MQNSLLIDDREISRRAALAAIRDLPGSKGCILVEQGSTAPGRAVEGLTSHARDIDFWTPRSNRDRILHALEELNGSRVCRCNSPAWLNHDVYFLYCSDGILQVDVTVGDLKVGPLTLASEDQLVASITSDHRFSGPPLIADLLLRPLARQNLVGRDRLAAATAAWQVMPESEKAAMRRELKDRLGQRATVMIEEVLTGAARQPHLMRALRMRSCVLTLKNPAALHLAIRKVIQVGVARVTGRSRPFGRYHRGLLVAFSGTDGVGKSTVVAELSGRLQNQLIRNATFYLGRARGNLPGIGILRNLVGRRLQTKDTPGGVHRISALTRLVSWYYAFEYVLRTLHPLIQARLLGKIVLCDRYVYDIQLMPGHSKTAAALAMALCPKPDINVCLVAPVEIVRRRKAERSEQVIAKQQEILGAVIEQKHARLASLRIDTHVSSVAGACAVMLRQIHKDIHTEYS